MPVALYALGVISFDYVDMREFFRQQKRDLTPTPRDVIGPTNLVVLSVTSEVHVTRDPRAISSFVRSMLGRGLGP